MRSLRADLHVHTALSPCASEEMTPSAIVRAAAARGLDVIAICDHNSCGNAIAVRDAAGDRLAVLPGIEITTREEIHVLGLFPGSEAAARVAAGVRRTLPVRGDRDLTFGRQILFARAGAVLRDEPRMLSAPCAWDLPETVSAIHSAGGLAVAAHLNRPCFSVLGRLGMMPVEAEFDALELDPAISFDEGAADCRLPPLARLYSSDAHSPEEIGRCATLIRCETCALESIAEAVRAPGGGRCCLA